MLHAHRHSNQVSYIFHKQKWDIVATYSSPQVWLGLFKFGWTICEWRLGQTRKSWRF